MKIYEVKPYRHYLNTVTGLRASIYGACPWVSKSDEKNWTLVTKGFTPFGTEAEALEKIKVLLRGRENSF